MKIHIEFCERWNYRPQFEQLAQALENKFPDIEVLGNQNREFRIGSFEITFGDEIIFFFLFKGTGFIILYLYLFDKFFKRFTSPSLLFPNLKLLLTKIYFGLNFLNKTLSINFM